MRYTDGVAVRLAELCLLDSGKLRRPDLADEAIRGGMLVDLALRGLLTDGEKSVTVDTEPTGFEPVDRLLREVAAHPDRSVGWWMQYWRFGVRDMAEYLVRVGAWEPASLGVAHLRRYYLDRSDPDGSRRKTARELLRRVIAGQAADPMLIAIACLAQSAGILSKYEERPLSDFVEGCGPITWIVRTVLECLDNARVVLNASAANAQVSTVGLIY